MTDDHNEGVDLPLLAKRLQQAQADLIHREDGWRGDALYVEALRRALADRRCGLIPTREAERLREQAEATARFNADQADRARREAAETVAAAHREMRPRLADAIRQRAHSLSGKYRQEGALAVADWLAPR